MNITTGITTDTTTMPTERPDFIPALRFHALTRFYDPLVRVTTREDMIKSRLIAGLGAPRNVLDLGSGTGTLLAKLREAYPDARLTGLDRDPVIIERARNKLQARGIDDVEIVEGDATNPPFAPQSFDRVVSSLMFHHLTRTQKVAALRAVRELLTADGEFHLADWGKAHDPLMRASFLIVQLLDGFATTRDNVQGGLPKLFTEAGFRQVDEIERARTPLGSISIYRGRP